jgi:hypothetical protein
MHHPEVIDWLFPENGVSEQLQSAGVASTG